MYGVGVLYQPGYTESVFALHILQNQHEYGHINNKMTLLKPLSSPNMFIPYEQHYIQALYREGKLIPEQYPGETNQVFQTVINPQPWHTAWIDQLCFSRQPGHNPSRTTS